VQEEWVMQRSRKKIKAVHCVDCLLPSRLVEHGKATADAGVWCGT